MGEKQRERERLANNPFCLDPVSELESFLPRPLCRQLLPPSLGGHYSSHISRTRRHRWFSRLPFLFARHAADGHSSDRVVPRSFACCSIFFAFVRFISIDGGGFTMRGSFRDGLLISWTYNSFIHTRASIHSIEKFRRFSGIFIFPPKMTIRSLENLEEFSAWNMEKYLVNISTSSKLISIRFILRLIKIP